VCCLTSAPSPCGENEGSFDQRCYFPFYLHGLFLPAFSLPSTSLLLGTRGRFAKFSFFWTIQSGALLRLLCGSTSFPLAIKLPPVHLRSVSPLPPLIGFTLSRICGPIMAFVGEITSPLVHKKRQYQRLSTPSSYLLFVKSLFPIGRKPVYDHT